jgi:hypothetical protein
LEECIRVCISDRQPLVNYWLGRAYKILKMQLKTFEYWQEALLMNKNLKLRVLSKQDVY